jgi:hypothetical protein
MAGILEAQVPNTIPLIAKINETANRLFLKIFIQL